MSLLSVSYTHLDVYKRQELFCAYEDVNEKLYVLSTYLGHVKPADTL